MKNFKNKRGLALSTQEILQAWNEDIPHNIISKQKKRSSRRDFFFQSTALAGSLALSQTVLAKSKINESSLKQPWLTISEVQNHLFPRVGNLVEKDSSPGAKDINAIGYLQLILNTHDADQDEREFVIKGTTWLDGMANNMIGKPFIKLNKEERERVLRKISESESGESWLSTLLRYIFEALLTDPVYGGNSHQIGWQWLEHQPGFPRPPANKKYWLLRNG